MLVVDLGKWMNKILIDWGIDAKVADRFDETIIAILMIAIAVGHRHDINLPAFPACIFCPSARTDTNISKRACTSNGIFV